MHVHQRKPIIHVSAQDPEHLSGGQGVAILALCLAQAKLGYPTWWISPCIGCEAPRQYSAQGIHVVKLRPHAEGIASFFAIDARTQGYRELFGEQFVRFISETFRPQDCYIHLHGFLEIPRNAKKLIASGFNVTSTFHMFLSTRAEATGARTPFLPTVQSIEKEAIRANTKIVVASSGMRSEILRRCPHFRGSLHIIPVPLSELDFTYPVQSRSGRQRVAAYGRISLEKGFDIFLEAAKLITKHRRVKGQPGVEFLLFGKTDDSILERALYEHKLRELASGFPNITLRLDPTGIWSEQRIRLIDGCSIGVVPSLYESFGLVLPEFMVRAKPVVATLTHGSRDILNAETYGSTPYGIITEGSRKALAESIEWLLDHPEEARAAGEEGEARAQHLYRPDDTARRVIEVYQAAGTGDPQRVSTAELFCREQIPFVEIHLANRCDQRCRWCTYKERFDRASINFADLDAIAVLRPEEILIVGGGEPTLYRSGDKTFNDVVLRFRQLLPHTKLRLITNGVAIPRGPWAREIAEVSISLDEPTAREYSESKGTDAFRTVLRNIARYLQGPIPNVRVTMLYNAARLPKAIPLAMKLWKLLRTLKAQGRISASRAHQLTFMLFPMADDSLAEDPYRGTESTPAEKREWGARLGQLRHKDPAFWRFILHQTNLSTQPLRDLEAPSATRCFSVSNYVLVGADRKIYPCFSACAAFPEHNLGSVDQSPERLLQRRKQLFAHPAARCARGCRPGSTFYGQRSSSLYIHDFRQHLLAKWDQMVNKPLAAEVATKGINTVEQEKDLSKETGIIWFPDQVKYKVLDTCGKHTRKCGPIPPSLNHLLVQYNESRGVPRGKLDRASSARGSAECPFCNMPGDFLLADLETHFGMPYVLAADSRPFFDKHMLVLAKRHSGGRLAFEGFRDLIWIHNMLFPGLKANIGTGNQEAHLHCHLYETEFPMEHWKVKWLMREEQSRIGRLRSPFGLVYFVVESSSVVRLAHKAYCLMQEIEERGLLSCVILSRNRVYVIPQIRKTIGNTFNYPHIFDCFKDNEHRPPDMRSRYVGPVEAAGIFLCYSRGDINAMKRMCRALSRPVFEEILKDTGLPLSSRMYRELASFIRVLFADSSYSLSFHDERAKDNALVGGKACNLHRLCELSESTKEPDRIRVKRQDPNSILNIPRGYTISTRLFDRVVLGEASIRRGLETLRRLGDQRNAAGGRQRKYLTDELCAVARSLRKSISKTPFPQALQGDLRWIFTALGGNVAVRSSAVVEDQHDSSWAGLADSFLNVTSMAGLLDAIRRVWASLYSDRSLLALLDSGVNVREAKMAVVIQKMVDVEAAGVLLSEDPRTHRPAFRVTAAPGPGSSVVNGSLADSWLVAGDARVILERSSAVSGAALCICDERILQLCRLARIIRDAYRTRYGIGHVDLEFAVDHSDTIQILQCRPVTTSVVVDKVRIRVADEQIGAQHEAVCFDRAVAANPNAIAARLQVLESVNGQDEDSLIASVQPGAILVVRQTNCRWNPAFAAISGLITEEGGENSHAAIHARESHIPCLIGATSAIEHLRQYDGRTVALDTGAKTVFVGEVPIREEVHDLSIWQEEGSQAKPEDRDSVKARDYRSHPNFMEDSEGNWFARPKIRYSPFQLDLYGRAYPRYECLLEHIELPRDKGSEGRPPVGRHSTKTTNGILYLKLDRAIADTMAFFKSLSLDNIEYLMAYRREHFKQFEGFLDRQHGLDSSNVEAILDGLEEVLALNTMGYEFREALASRHIEPQKQYISEAFWPLLLETAMPAALRDSTTRRHQKELLATAETISRDSMATDLVLRQDQEGLRTRKKGIHAKLEWLSSMYKFRSEDIRVLSETDECLRVLKGHLAQPDPSVTLHQVGDFCEEYVAATAATPDATLEQIKKRDHDLYWALMGYARKRFHIGRGENLSRPLRDVIAEVQDYLAEKRQRRQTCLAAFQAYPGLKKIASLAAQEQTFRNDAHHLLARFQRKIARFMLRFAENYPSLFKQSSDIFNLGVDEVVTLVQGGHVSYLGETGERNRLLEDAEL